MKRSETGLSTSPSSLQRVGAESLAAPPTNSSLAKDGLLRSTSQGKKYSYPGLRECVWCKTTFAPTKISYGWSTACSRACATKQVGKLKREKNALTPKPVKTCQECGEEFVLTDPHQKTNRFCGTSCSAKWRMRVFPCQWSEEEKQQISTRIKRWYASNSETAMQAKERIANLRPMLKQSARIKLSKTLKGMGHKPPIQGGNGKPIPVPQMSLFNFLHKHDKAWWELEYIVPTRNIRYAETMPKYFRLDIACEERKVWLEIDGVTHKGYKVKDADRRKTAAMATIGWKVLRFSNRMILDWVALGMQMDSSIFTTLASHGIHLTA